MKKALITILVLSLSCYGKTVYVDGDATGDAGGTSWDNACICLQDALSIATHGDVICVAEGIYRPDESFANPNGTGNRSATPHMTIRMD